MLLSQVIDDARYKQFVRKLDDDPYDVEITNPIVTCSRSVIHRLGERHKCRPSTIIFFINHITKHIILNITQYAKLTIKQISQFILSQAIHMAIQRNNEKNKNKYQYQYQYQYNTNPQQNNSYYQYGGVNHSYIHLYHKNKNNYIGLQ